jgi:hypothetical protein
VCRAAKSLNVKESMKKQRYFHHFGFFFWCAAKLVFQISVPQTQKG